MPFFEGWRSYTKAGQKEHRKNAMMPAKAKTKRLRPGKFQFATYSIFLLMKLIGGLVWIPAFVFYSSPEALGLRCALAELRRVAILLLVNLWSATTNVQTMLEV
jgi:hypothetical protein